MSTGKDLQTDAIARAESEVTLLEVAQKLCEEYGVPFHGEDDLRTLQNALAVVKGAGRTEE